MSDIFESDNFLLPSQLRNDVAARLKDAEVVKSIELVVKGDALEGAKRFSDALLALRKRGVKISHEVKIKIEFPKAISRDKTLSLVATMPKPTNGALRVRVQTDNRRTP